MSIDWTPEEIQMVSKEMNAVGHMGYEEFCKALEEYQAKAALERFGKMQTARITCPRCGKPAMKDPIHANALSRFADVYVCDMCGMAEALTALTGASPQLRNWAIIKAVQELVDE